MPAHPPMNEVLCTRNKQMGNVYAVPTSGERYVLCLIVIGESQPPARHGKTLHDSCERCLNAPCEITIYDVLESFQPALDNRVLVTPTLICVSPPPRVMILGNLSDTSKVVAALRRGGGV
jgi:hypothetical protein